MIAFIFDDRLPHDRKLQFHRAVTMLKAKHQIEILPSNYTEDGLIEHLEKNPYELVLLPWYKYLEWKKVDSHFGSLRMDGTTVAGYFADPVLPFDIGAMPTYHRQIILDFHRLEIADFELLIHMLTKADDRSGLSIIKSNIPVFHTEWTAKDEKSTRCVDEVMALPLLDQPTWRARQTGFRLFFTAMWAFAMPETAEIEIAEFQKRIFVKVLFKNSGFNLKKSMELMWPSHTPAHPCVREVHAQADFKRVIHYPETNQIEFTALFIPGNPSLNFPNEVRGYWIEPLPIKNLKKSETHQKLISIKDLVNHDKKKAA